MGKPVFRVPARSPCIIVIVIVTLAQLTKSTAHATSVSSREARCVTAYTQALSGVPVDAALQGRFAEHVRELHHSFTDPSLHSGATSDHGIVLGVGAGTTGTRGLAGALYVDCL